MLHHSITQVWLSFRRAAAGHPDSLYTTSSAASQSFQTGSRPAFRMAPTTCSGVRWSEISNCSVAFQRPFRSSGRSTWFPRTVKWAVAVPTPV